MRIEQGEWFLWIGGNNLATAVVAIAGIVGVVITSTFHLKGIAMKTLLDTRLDAFLKYESAFAT